MKKFSISQIRFPAVLKEIVGAIIMIILLLFILNNYVRYERVTIHSDGSGYYDYLPSLFIYGDFPNLKNNSGGAYSERVKTSYFYYDYAGKKYNKYPFGVALLLLPFFSYAHLTAALQGYPNNGFSEPYQKAVFIAAISYLFLSLIFLHKLLKLYNISWVVIFLSQLWVVFSTSILNYVNFEASFSHVYSFFAITAFLFFVKSFFSGKNISSFLWACVFIGVIIILRQVNFIVIFFVPFLAQSYENFKEGVHFILKKKWVLLSGISISFGIIFIQMLLWNLQTGKFIFDSYQNEHFHFFSPAFADILFSYGKGLFVYAPVLLLAAVSGILFFLIRRQYYPFWTWIFFFTLLVYVLSSWHDWQYGGGYGARAFVDYYSIFFIPFVLFLQYVRPWIKVPVILMSLATIPVTVIQTKQYKNYILLWKDMDKEKYWSIFLKQDDRFKGYLWKRKYSFNPQTTKIIKSFSLKDTLIHPDYTQEIFTEYSDNIERFNNVNIIQVAVENEFSETEDARMDLSITDPQTNEVLYRYTPPLIHFAETGLDKVQQGEFNYEFNPIDKKMNMRISLKIITAHKPVSLKKIKIDFIEYHH